MPIASRIGDLTRLSYLSVYSALAIGRMGPEGVLKGLGHIVSEFSKGGNRGAPSPDSIEMQPEQFREMSLQLPGFIVDLLIVHLFSVFLGALNDLLGRSPSDDELSLDACLNRLFEKSAKERLEWAWREAIVLNELRNAIVHGDGELNYRRKSIQNRISEFGEVSDVHLPGKGKRDY